MNDIRLVWLAEHEENDLHSGSSEGPISDIILDVRWPPLPCYIHDELRSFEVGIPGCVNESRFSSRQRSASARVI
jgi:hypothetical protein